MVLSTMLKLHFVYVFSTFLKLLYVTYVEGQAKEVCSFQGVSEKKNRK